MKKVSFEGEDPQTIVSYKNEIKVLNTLQGTSSIISLFASEIKEDEEVLFMVMEHGECDLSQILSGKTLLDFEALCGYWRCMLDAVEAIHRENIIHSDLKPAVIFNSF